MGFGLMDTTQWIPVAAFVLTAIGTVAGVVWKLTRVELRLIEKITSARAEIDDHLERQAREFGEVASALRTKVHEVEVWARDTFVRRDGFYKVKEELTAELKSVAAQINQRIDRLVDSMNGKQ